VRQIRPQYDVVVAGARCAGASTALLLARAGLRVLVADRGEAGADALSTHALMRGGVLQLRRWGLLPAVAAAAPAIRSATFHYGDEQVAVAVKPRDGVDALYAPRRTALDPLLVDAARRAGAQVEHGLAALDLVRDRAGRVAGAVLAGADGARTPVAARLVVGADGLRSRIAALAGAATDHAGRHATAVIYGHWSGLEVEGYHWHYRPGVSVGAIPTGGGRTCVFVALPSRRFAEELPRGVEATYRGALAAAAPGLARAMGGARLEAKLRPFAGVPGSLRRAWGPGWALVGDAGCFRDPITAHGITDALRDAELLAGAIVRGTDAALAGYQAARDPFARAILELSDRIASFAWDLDEVRGLHHALALQLAAEVELLNGLDRWPPAAGRAAAGPGRADPAEPGLPPAWRGRRCVATCDT
jgi:flavin-dependent dehydrogenase